MPGGRESGLTPLKNERSTDMNTLKGNKRNNWGRGFYFEFADGYSGWVLGFTTQERKVEIAKHGKLVRWVAA